MTDDRTRGVQADKAATHEGFVLLFSLDLSQAIFSIKGQIANSLGFAVHASTAPRLLPL